MAKALTYHEMATDNHSGEFAGSTRPKEPLSKYDELPREVRQLLQDAPYNYSTYGLKERLGSKDAKETIPIIQDKIQQHLKECVKLTYGPDHPQAQ